MTIDMGPCNKRIWHDFGIVLTKNQKPINSTPHPCDPNIKLWFFADVPHLFKNVTQGFLNYERIFFNESIVKKYNLKTNYA